MTKFGEKLSKENGQVSNEQQVYFGGPSPSIRLVYEYYVNRCVSLPLQPQPHSTLFHLSLSHFDVLSVICADLRGTAPVPVVLASPPPASSKAHSTSRPCRQMCTGVGVRLLVGCHSED